MSGTIKASLPQKLKQMFGIIAQKSATTQWKSMLAPPMTHTHPWDCDPKGNLEAACETVRKNQTSGLLVATMPDLVLWQAWAKFSTMDKLLTSSVIKASSAQNNDQSVVCLQKDPSETRVRCSIQRTSSVRRWSSTHVWDHGQQVVRIGHTSKVGATFSNR